jgi:mycoredoxin
MNETIIVYGHPACPGVPPVRAMLAQAKVPYTYVDIHQDAPAATLVRSIGQGNESVPMLVFPDGSALTEPSTTELKHKLEALGYQVGLLAWIMGNSWRIVTGLVVLYGLLRLFEIL